MFAVAPLPNDENERLRELERLASGGVPEPDLDRFTRLAAADLGCPIALVSLVEATRQTFASKVGLEVDETPRDHAFCAHAILDREPLVVPDAHVDARFAGNPLVLGPPHIRFYAGVPLVSRGHALGALCVIDTRPRELAPAQVERLVDLARLVEGELRLRIAARELEEAQAAFRELAELLPLPIVFHKDRIIRFANPAAAGLALVDEPSRLVGRRTDEFLVPEEQAQVDTRARAVLGEGRGAPERDFRLLRPGHPDVVVSAVAVPVNFRGETVVATVMRDVTRLRALEVESRTAHERLAAERALLTATLGSLGEGVALLSPERTLLYANPAYRELLRSPSGEPPATREELARMLAARSDDPDAMFAQVMAVTAAPAPHGPAVFELATPKRVVLERRTAPATGGETVVVWRDVTAEADLARQQERLALTDPLTQLLNRRGLEVLLPRDRALARRRGASLALIVLDIDRFKRLNDTHGHLTGDRVIVSVARIIAETCRASDLVARWGGEEFVALVEADEVGAGVLAERIRAAVERARPGDLEVTVSGGVAALRDDDESPEAALARADARLYAAKSAGRNRIG